MNALAAALIALGLALLDKRLDALIGDSKTLTKEQKQELYRLEDELIALLRDALKKVSPRMTKLLARAIPNDPSTGNWA